MLCLQVKPILFIPSPNDIKKTLLRSWSQKRRYLRYLPGEKEIHPQKRLSIEYVNSQEGSNFHTQTTQRFPIIPFFPFDLHLDDQATGSITYFHGHHSPQGGCHRKQNPSHTKQGSLCYQPRQRITIVESLKTTIHLHLMPPEKIPQLSSTFFLGFVEENATEFLEACLSLFFPGSKKSPPTFFSHQSVLASRFCRKSPVEKSIGQKTGVILVSTQTMHYKKGNRYRFVLFDSPQMG